MSLTQKFAVKTVMSIVSAVFSLVSLMFMSRYVGSEYGTMMMWWSVAGLINLVTDLGFNSACVKFIGENRNLNECISSFAALKMTMTAVLVVILLVYASVGSVTGTLSDDDRTILLMFLVYYVIYDLTWIMICSFDGLMDVKHSSIVQLSEVIVRSVFFIFLAYMHVSAVILSTGCLFGITASLFLALYYFRSLKFKFAKPVMIHDYISFMKPVFLGITMMTALTFIDKTAIGIFCSTQDVGYYSAATGVAYAITAFGIAINNVLLPKFSELTSHKDDDATKRTLWGAQKYVTMLLLPMLIVMAVFGNEIVIVFLGSGYSPAGTVLSILTVYVYAFVMIGIETQLLYSFNCLKPYKTLSIIFSAVTMILLFITIPSDIGGIGLLGLGINGAAMSISTGYVLFLLLLMYVSKRIVGVSSYPGLYKHAIITVIVGAAIYFIYKLLFASSSIFSLIAISLMCLILYFMMAFIFGEIKKDEVKEMVSMIMGRI